MHAYMHARSVFGTICMLADALRLHAVWHCAMAHALAFAEHVRIGGLRPDAHSIYRSIDVDVHLDSGYMHCMAPGRPCRRGRPDIQYINRFCF